jgi:catechol 2,3-dioxygenase-like lactoylglutathione lyase family enzyme
MFKIGKLYHLTHVVKELDLADQWYDDIFGVSRWYRQFVPQAVRYASMSAIGTDMVVEPVMLATHVTGSERSPIGKFQARFGQHFHSIAWYVDDLVETFNQLNKHNIRVVDVAGTMLKSPPPRDIAIWTHPKDTFGLLEFAEAPQFNTDSRFQPGFTGIYWREKHPLAIERTSHMTALVRDLPKAKAFYQESLPGKLIHEEEQAGQRKSAFIALGEDSVMELTQPISPNSPEGRELEQFGENIYSVTYKTRDLKRAADFLKSKNIRTESQGADSFMLNRDDAFGMVINFTQRRIPNDPRA